MAVPIQRGGLCTSPDGRGLMNKRHSKRSAAAQALPVEQDVDAYFAGLKERIAKALGRHDDERVRQSAESLLDTLMVRTREGVRQSMSILRAQGVDPGPDGEEAAEGRRDREVKDTVKAKESLLVRLQRLRRSAEGTASPQFIECLETEERRVQGWLAGIKSSGTARSRKNFAYNEALDHVASMLEWAGVPYSPVEAVAVLWHAGFKDFVEHMDVLSPAKKRRQCVGKDSRDAARSEIEKRLRYHEHRISEGLYRSAEALPEIHPGRDPLVKAANTVLSFASVGRVQRMRKPDT